MKTRIYSKYKFNLLTKLKDFKLLNIIICILLVSCATYSPKPLSEKEISSSLEMPKIESVNQQLKKNNVESIDFSKPLTARQVGIISVITNPSLKALRAKNQIAEAQVFDAGLLPDPIIMPGYEIPTTTGNGVTPAYSLWVNWDIGSLAIRSLKESAAKEQQKQISYDVAWQEWLIANQAELLATRLYYLDQQHKVIENNQVLLKNYLDEASPYLATHNLSPIDYNQQKINYIDIVDQDKSIERLIQKTNFELLKTIGLPPSAKLNLTDEFRVSHLANESELLNYAKKNRLDLLALQAGYNNQEIQVRQAILGQYPHFTMNLYPGQDNTSNGYFGINVAFDLPTFNRNQGAIAIALATRENLYLEYFSRLHNIRSDISSISGEISWATKQTSIMNNEMQGLRNTDILLKRQVNDHNVALPYYINFHYGLANKEVRLLSLQQDLAEQYVAMQITTGKYLNENQSKN